MNAMIPADLLSATALSTPVSDVFGDRRGQELLYTPSESIFAAAAPDMLANGWSVFPQEVDRLPGRVFGAPIKWSEDHDLKNKLPTAKAMADWVNHCATSNVACVFGPASGHTFAFDIDVLDEAAAADIACIADEKLGYTPLRREGRFPKLALIYRHAAEDAEAFRSRKIKLAITDAADSDDVKGEIEIQGAGLLLTFHGHHHKTGTYFKWLDHNPQIVGPEAAPLLTVAKLEAFISAVVERYGTTDGSGWRRHETMSTTHGNQRHGNLVATKLRASGDAKLKDNRETALRDLCFDHVRRNGRRIESVKAEMDKLTGVMDELTGMVVDAWCDGCEMSGRWNMRFLQDEARAKVRRMTRRLIQGGIAPDYRYEDALAAREAEAAKKKAEQDKNISKDAVKAEKREVEPPYTVLGHDRGRYYILCRSGQVRDFSARDLATEATLLELDNIDFWHEEYCGAKGGINAKRAANDIIEQAYAVGIYDPDRLRGRGVHLDGGKVVAHMGDRLIVDGVEMKPRSFRGRYMYEVALPMPVVIGHPPMNKEEAKRLIEVCKALPLPEGYGELLAGWIITASVCGAMPWRPHGWMTGENGSGKSWTIENIIRPLLGALALAAQSKTTEAGLRGKLRTDALTVIFDEAETQNPRDRDRMQQVLDLARQASAEGGPDIIKGTADGGARSFRIRSCFLFSSINLGMTQAADESRTIVFDFAPVGNAAEREVSFQKLCDLHAEIMVPDFSGRLFSRTLKLLPTIRDNAEVLAQALARSGRKRRLGDTLGVPLAGLWSLQSDDKLTPETADAWLKSTPWVQQAATRNEAGDEWRRALDYMLQTISKVTNTNGLVDNAQLGDLIEAAAGWGTPTVGKVFAQAALSQWGIKVEGHGLEATVLIANTSRGLAEAFANSEWNSSWATTIARTPGAKKPSNPVRFSGGLKCRATELAFRRVVSED